MEAVITRSCYGGLLSAGHQSYPPESKFSSKVFVAPDVGVTSLDGNGPSVGLFDPFETIEIGGELSSGPFWNASLKPMRSSFRPGLGPSKKSHIGKGITFKKGRGNGTGFGLGCVEGTT